MRIALDVRSMLGASPGGVGGYTRSFLSALRSLPGRDIRTVVTGRSPVPSLPDDDPTSVRFRVPNPLVNGAIAFLHRPQLDRLAGADRYVLPNWNFLALAKDTELTLVVHDLSFERNPGWYAPKQRLWHRAVSPRALVARADRLIAVSAWTKQDLTALYGVASEKVAVIHPVPESPPAELPFPAGLPERFILFLGAVEERKNPLSLVSAFERIATKHADVSLVIAGKHGHGAERVVDAARRSAVASRIRILGYVPVPVRHALYAKASVFAYPSFYEGFGIPLLEAMRAGLPVVAGNRTAMPEVVGDAGVLVDPGDVAELADALDEILGNRSFAWMLAERAKARATTFPDTMTDALAKLF